MAKRDKLYTVNKWNKKLFAGGGDTNYGFNPFVKTGQGSLRQGYGYTWGLDAPILVSNLMSQNLANPKVFTRDDYVGKSSPYRNMATLNDYNLGSTKLQTPTTTTDAAGDDAGFKNFLGSLDIPSMMKTAKSFVEAAKTPAQLSPSPKPSALSTTTQTLNTFVPKGFTATYNPVMRDFFYKQGLNQQATDFAKTLSDTTTLNLPDKSGLKHLKLNPNNANTASSGISNLGKAGVGIGASILGEVGNKLISDGFNTVPGTLINQIGSTAGSLVSLIPGVGWAVGPAVTLGSKLIGGLYNRAFGSEYKDNGATAYTNTLNSLNPNGSNEYLASLLANTGLGPRATSRNGWLNHDAERKANRTNEAQGLAYDRFRRGVDNAISNNNTVQLWNALNDYYLAAMGGKLNRCKCNKKSYGGYLDSASPTGFNFLSDLTNIQTMKNQGNQNVTTSTGNSFMNTPDMGTLFANGGITIKPENRGKLTRLKKRTGKTEAELYNDGNPEHKKMVVFARNARKWKKAYGGFLDAANNLSEIEKTLYGNGGTLENTQNQNIGNNSFVNEPTLFALGGVYQAAGSNWGRTTETQTSIPNKGYNVGDVIEIDEAEAELLKKLGYEYKIVE